MPYSEAQKKATLKYRKEKYARISLDLKAERKELYKQYATKKNVTLNAFIIEAVDEKISREQEQSQCVND